jgi:putative sterol carrier protein
MRVTFARAIQHNTCLATT